MPTFDNEDLIMRQSGSTTARIDTSNGNLKLGANGHDGDLELTDATGNVSIHLNGARAQMFLGNQGQDGNLIIRDAQNQQTIFLDGDTAKIDIGRNGQDGDLNIKDAAGNTSIQMNGARAQMFLGNQGQDGNLIIRNAQNQQTIFLDGDTGDIQLSNGDCAEEFDVVSVEGAEPGTVMVLNEFAELEPSQTAYDSRVAGIVAGAGSYQPGIVLDKRNTGKPRLPVALMGKVYVMAEARAGAIRVGDLLTTSDLPGHAMKVGDPTRALGAIIGKAMGTLEVGDVGLIPVLVSLQ